MTCARRGRVGVIALIATILTTTPLPGQDVRGQELVRLDCTSDLGRHDVTLFANGVVRLRQGPQGKDGLILTQIDEETLAGVRKRLRREDLSESDTDRVEIGGLGSETCTLTLSLEDQTPQAFRFQGLDTLSLAQHRLLAVVHDLKEQAEKQPEGELTIPAGYEPRPGDVLRRHDGELYEVIAITADRQGVELQGVDQPLTLYVAKSDLVGEFVELVRRRPRLGR